MHCARCGTECLPEQKFCKNCGNALAADGAQAIPPVFPPLAVQAAPPPPPAYYPPPAAPMAYPAAQPLAYQAVPQPVYYVTAQAAATQAHHVQQNVMHNLRARIQSLASTEELEGFSLPQMFSEVFKRRGADEVEDYILVGTLRTTPPIDVVETGWPKPWLFFRLLAALVIAYAALTFICTETGNTNCIPGIMFLGAFAVPLATLMLFFELNSPRNVSLHMVGKLFLAGAVISLGVALLGYSLPIFQLGTWEAGIVEEVAKLLTVVVIMRTARFKYILNGILFGATVGAGFACFETAGYALNDGFLAGLLPVVVQTGQLTVAGTQAGVSQMLSILLLRGILSPLGHVAWTAIAAGAFWRVKGDKPFSVSMLFDHRFLMAFLIPVSMHAIWDAPWQLPFLGNDILTGLISWYVVFGLVQQGLHQVKDEQKMHLQTTLDKVEASLQAPGTVTV
jgi:RsiW-degrading membrane proteinase PrsW (M82 family)